MNHKTRLTHCLQNPNCYLRISGRSQSIHQPSCVWNQDIPQQSSTWTMCAKVPWLQQKEIDYNDPRPRSAYSSSDRTCFQAPSFKMIGHWATSAWLGMAKDFGDTSQESKRNSLAILLTTNPKMVKLKSGFYDITMLLFIFCWCFFFVIFNLL